jgi:hypothetical protein
VERGSGDLVGAVRQIWDGVRDEKALCEALNLRDALIVGEILKRFLQGFVFRTHLNPCHPPISPN